MHIRTFPSFLGTGTMLATHSGYRATAKKPASNWFLPLLLSLRTSRVSSFLVFVSLGNNRDSRATYAEPCRGLSWAYHGMTKRRCLGSLIAEPPIHLEYVWPCPCQPLPLSFPHQRPSLRFSSLLGVASSLSLLVRPFFLVLGEAPNLNLLHPQFGLLAPQNRCWGPRY